MLDKQPNRLLVIGVFTALIMVGLLMGRSAHISVTLLLGLTGLTAALSCWNRAFILVFAAILGLTLGYWRGASFANNVTKYNGYFEKTLTMSGIIAGDVGVDEQGQLEFHITKIYLDDEITLPGHIRIRSRQKVDLNRGDTIEVKGKLRKTLGTTRQASMTFAEIKLIQKNNSLLEQTRQNFSSCLWNYFRAAS